MWLRLSASPAAFQPTTSRPREAARGGEGNPMAAEIVVIGTELLLGQIIDTNAAYLAQQLSNIGVDLYYKSTVGDNKGRIVEVLKLATGRSDIVITTGGIGPTLDDMPRESGAEVIGVHVE